MAARIIVNAKVQRPGVCNAAETLLVHADVAAAFLPARPGRAARARASSCAATSACARSTRRSPRPSESDWAEEFLALILAVRRRRLRRGRDRPRQPVRLRPLRGDRHQRPLAARAFQLGIDSACLYVNASTRFTDGGEFGMGAEIGNSTQKLHARGPIGLRELCSTRYLVDGDGQIRG